MHRPNHVQRRDTFRDGNDQFDSGIRGFNDRVRTERRRDKDHCRIRAEVFDGSSDRVEDRKSVDCRAALAGRNATDVNVDVRLAFFGVLARLLRVEQAGFSSNALGDHPGFFADENTHGRAVKY